MRDYTMGMPDVTSYDQLRDHYDKQTRWRGGEDRPFGMRKYSNRRMRMLYDGTIELEYMSEPLVRWHPDGDVSVQPFVAQRQGCFDRQALPAQIWVGLGNRTGPLIYLMDQGDGFWLSTPIPEAERKHSWQTHSYRRNPHVRVLRGGQWVRLSYCAGVWQPVDEQALKPFEWYEPDKSRTRKMSAEYHIPDFVNAARAMIALGADPGTDVGERWRGSLAYRGTDTTDDLLDALKRQDFAYVMKNLRRGERYVYDKLSGVWTTETTGVSSTDLKALRDRVYVLTGICEAKSERIVSLDEYHRIERRLKDFGRPE